MWLLAAMALQSAPQDAAPISFSRNVAPILTRNCVSCHSGAQPQSQFELTTRESALKGGQKGPAILPLDAAGSALYRRLTGQIQPSMPLGGRLTDAEIAILKNWIDGGARWEGGALKAEAPGGASREKVFSERDRNWWAFRRPVRQAIPEVADPRWKGHPVDAFIKKSLDEKSLTPAPQADRRTLIRRAYLDLIGLLPPPETVEAFVVDPAPDAWEKQIERLLASPHYGERWGRHWLDVARYADSWGHIHDDDNPNAWRYRDYVIQSFNQDKPYDRFIREQLAGDELDDAGYDAVIATGFHRIGPRVLFREKQNPHYRYDYLDDMIATTTRAFVGLTVSCARCHDHKFDAISQMDYYRMMGIFFSFIDYDHPLAPAPEVEAADDLRSALEAKIRPLRERVRQIEEPYRQAAFAERLKTFPEDIQVAVRTPEDQRTPGQQLLATQVLSVRDSGMRALRLSDADRELRSKLDAEIRELTRQLPQRFPVAAGIRDGDYRFTPDGPGDTPVPGTTAKRIKVDFDGSYVPRRGKPYEPPPLYFPAMSEPGKGTLVEPGFLSVITGGGPASIRPLANGRLSSGRRLALAEWIASPDNPLTARVLVNRLWHHHFGRGIVATPSNFGRLGGLPSHPQLLDWLATEFVRQGWRIKPIHRLILTSETYRMSAAYHSPANMEADPNNVFLWRFPMRRVEAEIVRDLMLSASGQLNPQAGGPPFFPSLPQSVHEEVKRVGKWVLTREEPATWRRSVYAYWKRARKHPMFEVFDQPDTMVTCERRNVTTVATQALTLLNNEFVLLQSQHFAARVAAAAGPSPDARVRTAYRIALSRDPSAREMAENLQFLERQLINHGGRQGRDASLLSLTDLCDVILNLNEFLYVE
ncbi:MAG: PSD1 and planctomycete cytochrome C domain-containing protein [Bryobacteraceae bacterium]